MPKNDADVMMGSGSLGFNVIYSVCFFSLYIFYGKAEDMTLNFDWREGQGDKSSCHRVV